MNNKYKNKRISLIVAVIFWMSQILLLCPRSGFAQSMLNLPAPGVMILPSTNFTPVLINGLIIDSENPFSFDFIIDRSDDNLHDESFKSESQKVISYFLTSLTVPDDEMWVNLSPYEEDRIIAKGLGDTVMGNDMLVQDYLLKQLTASLMYPDEEIGEEFWSEVYAKAEDIFGTSEVPANVFNKIWIVPQEASVYVNDNKVFIVDSHLSVMLEQDYLALEMNQETTKHGVGDVDKSELDIMSDAAKQAVKNVLLPVIEHEINHGKNFANLRQIYHSMILATWYKQHLRSSIFGQLYIDRNKTEGVDVEDKNINQKIYEQYVSAFEKGVFNFIREDYDAKTQEMISRKYFSGGLENVKKVVEEKPSVEWMGIRNDRNQAIVRTDMAMINSRRATDRLDVLKKSEISEARTVVMKPKEWKQRIFYLLGGANAKEVWNESREYTNEEISSANSARKAILERTGGKQLKTVFYPGIGFDIRTGLELSNANVIVGIDNEFDGNDFTSVIDIYKKVLKRLGAKSIQVSDSHNKASFAFIFKGKKKELVIYKRDVVEAELTNIPELENGYDGVIFKNVPIWNANFIKGFLALLKGGGFFVENNLTTQQIKEVILDSGTRKLGNLSVQSWHEFQQKHPVSNPENITFPGVGGEFTLWSKSDVGGIDFNPNALNIKTKGSALSFTLPSLQSNVINNIEFTGYAPVIINITPITNFFQLLGLADQNKDYQLSQL